MIILDFGRQRPPNGRDGAAEFLTKKDQPTPEELAWVKANLEPDQLLENGVGEGADGSTSDDGGSVGPGSPGPTGGTFASLAESDPNAALHPGYAPGPSEGTNAAEHRKKQHQGNDEQVANAKVEKASVHYRLGTPQQHCGICAMFVDPDKCTSVEGDIKREKVCDLFEPAEG